MVIRVVALIHRYGLELGFTLYLMVVVAILVCGFMLKWGTP